MHNCKCCADIEITGQSTEKIGNNGMLVANLRRTAVGRLNESLPKLVKSSHRIGRVLKALLRKIRLRAIMRLNKFIAQNRRMNGTAGYLAFEHIAHRKKIALALGHLLAFNHQIARVNPVIGKMQLPRRTTRLGNLAFVVRKNIILAPSMNIDDLAAQHFHRHGRAFNMPARIALAPWRRPFHNVRRIGFPHKEISGIALDRLVFLKHAPTRTRDELIEIIARQTTVFGKRLNTKINNAIIGNIGMAFIQKLLNHHLYGIDMFGGTRHIARIVVRHFNTEQTRIFDKCIREILRHLIRIIGIRNRVIGQCTQFFRLLELARSHRDFVFARRICHTVIRHMSHIGNIHYMRNIITGQFEEATEHIGKQKSLEIANMGKIVHRWTT